MNCRCSANTNHSGGTLTQTTLIGLEMPLVAEVQTVFIQALSGTYSLGTGAAISNITLDYSWTAAQVEAALETVYGSAGVRVEESRALSNPNAPHGSDVTYTIFWGGSLAGQSFQLLTMPSNTLVANAALNQSVITKIEAVRNVPNSTPNSTLPDINTAQTLTVDATGGSFDITFPTLNNAVATINFGDSAAIVLTKLSAILNPNNASLDLPHTDNVAVNQFGNVYVIIFQGVHRTLRLTQANINAAGLTGGNHSVQLATRVDGINYYGVETLNIDLGSGDDVFNVQGTTASTNLNLRNGNDRVYVSDLADVTQATKDTADFLPGKLNALVGRLNIDAGLGTNRLMVSDESTEQGDGAVVVTNEMIQGLAPAEIHYVAAATGTFAHGITIWTSNLADTVTVHSTHLRSGARTITTLNTGAGDDTVTVTLLDGMDGDFVLNTQAGNDVVDASNSSLPLILFGGDGLLDRITGGTGNDLIFGDVGQVLYHDGNVNQPMIVLGNGGPGDKTDGLNHTYRVEVLIGSPAAGSDVIIGRAGDDMIFAQEADDIVIGDDGSVTYDVLTPVRMTAVTGVQSTNPSEIGNDVIQSNEGHDILFGGAANDILDGDSGVATPATDGNDVILGDEGSLTLFSSGVSLFGAAATLTDRVMTITASVTTTNDHQGADTITGTNGEDIILGGNDRDTISGNIGRDVLFGDQGEVGLTNRIASLRDRLSLVQTAQPTQGANDQLHGNDDDDFLFGGGNNDIGGDLNRETLNGNAGSDLALGDYGKVTLVNGVFTHIETTNSPSGGNDTIEGQDGHNVLLGGAGADTIETGNGNNIVLGDDGQIAYALDGDASDIDLIESTSTVLDGAADASLGGGADSITTGAGADIVIGGRYGDTINAGHGSNLVIGDSGRVTAANSGVAQFTGVAMTFGFIETIAFGDGGADGITSGTGNDIILGGHLGDTISASSGSNIVVGDDGQIDYVRLERASGGTPGADTDASDIDLIESLSTNLRGGADAITTLGNDDIIIGGRFNDTINAGDGSNLVVGDSGRITAANGGAAQFGGMAMTFGLIETIEFNDGGVDTINTGVGKDIILGGDEGDVIVANVGEAAGNDLSNIVLGDDGKIDYVRVERGATLNVQGADADAVDIDLIESNSTATDGAGNASLGGGADHITSGDAADIVLGGRENDTVSVGNGSNLVIGDSGRITAANSGVAQFTGLAMTFGLIETSAFGDGGADGITSGTGNDIVLGGHLGDTNGVTTPMGFKESALGCSKS